MVNIRATMAHSKIGGAAAGHTVVWIWIKDAEANGAKQIFLLLNLHCTISIAGRPHNFTRHRANESY